MERDRCKEHVARVLSGQIFAMFALMLVAIVGFAGLAIDVGLARAKIQDIQRAAEAAALAGVVYLPDSTSSALSTAAALSATNGFTDNCTATGNCGKPGDVQIQYTARASERQLTVHISTWVPTFFSTLFGIGAIPVGRTATATYADPIQLGAPDHVMGLAIYPTKAVKTCPAPNTLPDDDVNGTNCQSDFPYPQGFWLELRGPYTGLEHGDAFSPYFGTVSGDKLYDSTNNTKITTTITQASCTLTASAGGSNSVNPVDPHAPPYSAQCPYGSASGALLANPYYDQLNAASDTTPGYNFVFTIPPPAAGHTTGAPVLLKILDPFDECAVSNSTSLYAPNGPSYGSSANRLNITGTEIIDQCSSGYWSDGTPPTTLQFQVFEPTDQLADATKTAAATAGVDSKNNWTLVTNNGASGGTETFGKDPDGSHAYKWFTFAEFTNSTNRTQYVRINVQAILNAGPDGTGKNSNGGSGGNSFALGICKSDTSAGVVVGGDANMIGNQASGSEFSTAGTDGTVAPSPLGSASGYDSGCADPNVTTTGDSYAYGQCADGSVTCYRINAVNAFCQVTIIQSGTAIIPIAELDSHLANSDITLRLFDAGDIGSGGTNTVNILGPNTDPSPGTNGDTNPAGFEKFSLDLGAPSGSAYSNAGQGRNSMSWWGNSASPYNCSSDYSADLHPNSDGPICPPLTTLDTGGGVNTGAVPANSGSNVFGNDVWMDFHIHIPSTYSPQAYGSGDTSLNDWWKVLYTVTGASGAGSDTTTWEVDSGAAPVHLTSVS